MDMDRRMILQGMGAATLAAASSAPARAQAPAGRVIDVHTHMASKSWVDVAKAQAADPNIRIVRGPKYDEVWFGNSNTNPLTPEFFDWDLRLANMDMAGVSTAVVSLTAPNVYWGDSESSSSAARAINTDFAAAHARYGARIHWMASLPWQYPQAAIAELERAKAEGAVAICTLTNILGKELHAPEYQSLWSAIEGSGLPVFVHPTRMWIDALRLSMDGLANGIGFTTETSLCFARMIFDGFFDRFPGVRIIASHGGGALPFLISRFDRIWDRLAFNDRRIKSPPSSYLRRIWFDSILYDEDTLEFLVKKVGADRVLFGSDYPFRLGDMRGIRARVDKLPTGSAQAVRSTNAAALFGI